MSIAVGGDSAGGNLTLGLINRLRAAGEELPACAWLISPWTDLTMSGEHARDQGRRRSADSQGLSRRACGCLRAAIHRSPRSADLAAVCRSGGLSAGPDSGRIGRDIARGRDAACRGRRRGRCRCDAADLAAHDPCLAGLECWPPGRPARAGVRRPVHPGAYPLAQGPVPAAKTLILRGFARNPRPPGKSRVLALPRLCYFGTLESRPDLESYDRTRPPECQPHRAFRRTADCDRRSGPRHCCAWRKLHRPLA